MACLDEDQIAAFLARALSPGDLAALEAHIDSCGRCRQLLADMARVATQAPATAGGAPSPPAAEVTAEPPGRYTLGNVHGRGGQAVVLVAYDHHTGREVAFKQLLPAGSGARSGAPTPQSLTAAAAERFLREARVTCRLEHPNIVPVYEVGRRADGTLYYTMRLVRGATLAAGLKGARTLEERLRLLEHVLALCRAVAYAHGRGVLHRDLKPQNVMVGDFGETVLLDWGLAKARGQSADEPAAPARRGAAQATLEGAVVGTPCYMSPEQARGSLAEVDELSDVWGLGAILYEVLTGAPPITGDGPEAILARAADGRVAPVRTRAPGVPPDLAAIAEKALRRNRAERYPSAQALAQDLAAYMSGLRVGAYRYSAFELLLLFARQHKAAVVAALAVLGVLVAAVVVISFSYQRERTARADEARARAREAGEHARASAHLAQAFVQRGGELLSQGRFLTGRVMAAAALVANPDRAGGDGTGADPLAIESRLTGIEARAQLARAEHAAGKGIARVGRTPDCANRGVFSQDGSLMACSGADGTLSVTELPSGRPRLLTSIAGPMPVDLALSGDNRTLAVSLEDGAIALWDLASGATAPVRRFKGHAELALSLAFSPDGRRLASAGYDKVIKIWDLPRGTLLAQFTGARGVVADVEFSPDGAWLAAADIDSLLLVDATSGRLVRRLDGKARRMISLAFSPDGRVVAASTGDHEVRLYRLADGAAEPWRTIATPEGLIETLDFSPDGRLLAAVGEGPAVRLLDVEGARALENLEGHNDSVWAVRFVRAGRGLLSADFTRRWIDWDLDPGRQHRVVARHGRLVYGLALSPDGGVLATGGNDDTVRLWAIGDGTPAGLLREQGGIIEGLEFSPDGALLAVGGGRALIVWAPGGPTELWRAPLTTVKVVCFSPDGARLAASAADAVVRVYDARGGQLLASLAGHRGEPSALAFSPDGRFLASAAKDDTVRLWDRDGKPVRVIADLAGLRGVRFSPDGKTLLTVALSGAVAWDTVAFKPVRRFSWGQARLLSARYSPDGRVLAANTDAGVVLWSAETGEPLRAVRTDEGGRGYAFTPDGRSLLVADGDQVQVVPLDLGDPGADPREVLRRAEVAARVHLEGFFLVPTEDRESH